MPPAWSVVSTVVRADCSGLGHLVDRDAPAVVPHLDPAVGHQPDVDAGAEPRHRLVHRVVDHLPDEVVEPTRPGRSDVHRRAPPYRLQTLQHRDGGGVVGRAGGRSGLSHRTPRAVWRHRSGQDSWPSSYPKARVTRGISSPSGPLNRATTAAPAGVPETCQERIPDLPPPPGGRRSRLAALPWQSPLLVRSAGPRPVLRPLLPRGGRRNRVGGGRGRGGCLLGRGGDPDGDPGDRHTVPERRIGALGQPGGLVTKPGRLQTGDHHHGQHAVAQGDRPAPCAPWSGDLIPVEPQTHDRGDVGSREPSQHPVDETGDGDRVASRVRHPSSCAPRLTLRVHIPLLVCRRGLGRLLQPLLPRMGTRSHPGGGQVTVPPETSHRLASPGTSS